MEIHLESFLLKNQSYIFNYNCSSNICYPYNVSFPSGTYQIECWGAQGGNCSSGYGGKGAYTSGILKLTFKMNLYIYVGNSGTNNGSPTFNGGGKGVNNGGSGGGATDIRLIGGDWDQFESLKSRIMVAAGGGGGVYWVSSAKGGYGGDLIGSQGHNPCGFPHPTLFPSLGGSQVSGGNGGITVDYGSSNHKNGTSGKFGYGGHNPNVYYGSGGGGGYYGGGGGATSEACVGTGAGGSSYISGFDGCNSIDSLSEFNSILHTNTSIHSSGYFFGNPVMINGNSQMPSIYNVNINGNFGKGFVRVTLLDSEISFGQTNGKLPDYHIGFYWITLMICFTSIGSG